MSKSVMERAKGWHVLWGCALFLISCNAGLEEPEADYSKCRYERPEAIFYDGLAQISNHRFERRGRGAEESFLLAGSIQVSIIQYGCDYRTQEFIFELPERQFCEHPRECTAEIIRLLQTLARLGPEYHVFRAWAQAIKDATDTALEFAEERPLAEGFWVKINKQQGFGSTTLLLTLSEKP